MSLYPCGEFSSATLCYEAAQEIDAAGRARAVVLFLGSEYRSEGSFSRLGILCTVRENESISMGREGEA